MIWIGVLLFLMLAVADSRWIGRRGEQLYAPGIGYAFALAAVATLGLCATGVDWGIGAVAIMPYLMVAFFTLLPYAVLALFLRGPQWTYRAQWWGLALLVATAAMVFGGYRLSGVRTNGWDFFQVPVLQLVLAVAMHLSAALVAWARSRAT